MHIGELFLIGFGLSMDAFAVSICKGLSMKASDLRKGIIIGLYFGLFQALMPMAGYFLGTQFEPIIKEYDHWIILLLLGSIGMNMIRESRRNEEESDEENISVSFLVMLPLAIATSIDALAVGVSLGLLKVNIFQSAFLIGCTTFVCSIAGVKIGNIFGKKYKSKAELLGGIILIIIGVKILFEHLSIL